MYIINTNKKWKIIRTITTVILIIFLLYILVDMVVCMKMTYPHPMLGIDALNWTDQFMTDLKIIMLVWTIPLLIDIIFLVLSIIKIKKEKIPTNTFLDKR